MPKLIKLCCVLLLLSACTKQIGPNPRIKENETFKTPQGNIVNAPLDFSFLVQNPINSPLGLVLKNKTVEAKILKDIAEMREKFDSYTHPVNLPPYVGLLQTDMSQLKLVDHYYHASSFFAFNFNNIYSLYFWGKYTFDDNGTMVDVYVADALNFDLTTGNQLTVSDLLVNGADVQRTFNGLLTQQFSDPANTELNFWPFESQQWEEEEPFSFQLTDAFSGIKGNQLFYIGLEGINFIFDDRHPEFKTGNNPLVFHIPFYKLSEELAISERFKTETSIYQQPVWDGRLLTLTQMSESAGSETLLESYQDIDIFLVTQTSDIPASYKDALPETNDDERFMLIEKIKSLIDLYSEPSQISRATITKSVSALGNYISVEWILNLDTQIQGMEHTVDYVFHVYNKHGKALTLDDIFAEGFSYQDLLMDRMKNFENFEKYSQQELIDSLQFSLYRGAVRLHTSLLKSKEFPGAYYSGFWYYYEIGIENLTLPE